MGHLDFNKGLICLAPFHALDIFYEKVFFCCPDWTKFQLGNLSNQSIQEIWNSDSAKYIRRKMFEGAWNDICNPCCPYISNFLSGKKMDLFDESVLSKEIIYQICNREETLTTLPTVIKLDNSPSCNLSCIMCDRHYYKEDKLLIDRTIKDIYKFLPDVSKLIVSGSGEPLAISYIRKLLMDKNNQTKHIKFDIITNALLWPSFWDRIRHRNFGSILVSIDAATEKTYEYIRHGGKWRDLQQALSLFNKNYSKFESITINMTVMRSNYSEIPAFIELAEKFDFGVSFQRIRGNFEIENIFDFYDSAIITELQNIYEVEKNKLRKIKVFWGDIPVQFMNL